MLFSIPEPGWWAIAIAATAFFVLALRALPVGLDIPDDVRSEWAGGRGRGKRAFYLITPLLAAGVLASRLVRWGPSPSILFLYSVAFVAIPIAVFPMRGRMFKAYMAQRQNPGAEEKPDRLVVTWIVVVLSVALIAAVIALMSSSYDPPSRRQAGAVPAGAMSDVIATVPA